MKRPSSLRFTALTAVAMLLGLIWAPPAVAHLRGQSYVYLDVSDRALSGRVELALTDVETVLGLDISEDVGEVTNLLEENLEIIQQYASDHLSIGSETQDWVITFSGVELLNSEFLRSGFGFAVLPFVVDVPNDVVPRDLTIGFDAFLDEVDGRDAVVLIANDWQGGVIDNESEALVAFDRGHRRQTVDLGNTGQWQNFTASIDLGLNHIRTGSDHILFILVLLLPAVLVFVKGWQAADSFGAAIWRVLKIATMFTIAHSITLSLAGLDLLPLPPSRIVESIIALSIAAAALHNLRPIAANREWAIAFAFGLFHGMGFASLVGALDVSRTTQLISLLARNVGIELGQALVILLAFPGLYVMRRTRVYMPFFIASSLALTFVAAVWSIERALAKDSGMSARIDSVITFPRSLWLVAAFTVLASGARWLERRRLLGQVSTDQDTPAAAKALATSTRARCSR